VAPHPPAARRRQLEDYRTALGWTRAQDEFDAARIFVWGNSFAGMHIVELAASEPGLAGASWPNEITARSLLDVTVHRLARRARKARCPLLMIVAEHDTMAPTGPALAVATRARLAELYRSRGGHYDVYAGGLDHENVLRVEASFLRRHAGMPDD
jgi:uncharacterized protein